MILTEKKSLSKIRTDIEQRLSEKYPVQFVHNDKKCMKTPDDLFFIVSALKWRREDELIVVEYADTLGAAEKGIFGEDGDFWYIDEMTEDEIYEAIVNEIEN